ncbi:MAG: ABC transporter permease [Planctomycetes bacterium]|nr:ABC transporter permease [Planctomycetota bacterium]
MAELRELLVELWADRRRLALVVFALTWGTLGLVVLAGFGQGFDDAMRVVVARSGERMLRLSGGSTTRPFDGVPAGRPVRLEDAAVDALRELDGVRRVSREYALSARLRAGARSATVNLRGVEPDFAAIRGLTLRGGGRFVSAIDDAERRRVIVLGESLAHELFGATDPVGREVQVGASTFVVVGVVVKRAMVMNYDGEDAWKAFAPVSTLKAGFALRWPSYVLVELEDPAAHAKMLARVVERLAARLRFDPRDDRAIWTSDHAGQAERIGWIVGGTRLFLLVVGVLGLLVAAVGIANSTRAMVEERVAEIGVRMALGATRRQIVARPLLEALVLVLIGGGAGLGLGTLLLMGLAALPLDATARDYLGSPVPTPGVALGVASVLGLVAALAGLAPARRAASVDPVEALRHE